MARRPGTGTSRSIRRSTYAEIDNITNADLAADLRQAHNLGRPELVQEAYRKLRVDEDDEATVAAWLAGELS